MIINQIYIFCTFNMAERKGFEPLIPLTVYTLSKRAPSTTRPSLQVKGLNIMINSIVRTSVKNMSNASHNFYII